MTSEDQDKGAVPRPRDEAESHTALVVWGSTGRRVQFSLLDLKMPDHIKNWPNHHYFEQQWERVSKFWYTRVLKESALQNLSVQEIVQRVEGDIARRWKRRRSEQAVYKKSKRLLTSNQPAGQPSTGILVTNIVGWTDYDQYTEDDKRDLVRAIVERVENMTKSKVMDSHVLVDEDDIADNARRFGHDANVLDALPKRDVENTSAHESGDKKDGESKFDDHVAVVCILTSIQLAARAIAHIHGTKFDGRMVLCRFAPVM